MKLLFSAILFSIFLINDLSAKIFILIGPSGVGKTTLINQLRSSGMQFDDLISYTTRPARSGEVQGKDYFFINKIDYDHKEQAHEFIISTQVHKNWYGISINDLDHQIKSKRHLVCSLNTVAAKKIAAIYAGHIVTIFVAPPCFEVLKNRLYQREVVETQALKTRLANAHQELVEQDDFDYKIINDDLDMAVNNLKAIFFNETSANLVIQHSVKPVLDKQAIRVMSYNIRMAPFAQDDQTENAWIYRLPKIKLILDQYLPDLIGLQECSQLQINDFKDQKFNLDYQFIAKYPSRQPVESGLAIAYNPAKLVSVSALYTVWLNEKQVQADAPAWDGSNYERYVIYAKFKNIHTQKELWFMTTHFDHLGIRARQQSAKIIMDLAAQLDAPVVISGDFNCFPQLGGSDLYNLLCSHNLQIKDSGKIAQHVFGVPGSWMGWDYDLYKQRGPITSKYDFIFVQGSLQVLQHGIIDDYVWDNKWQKALYPSDHRPVISDLII